MTWLSGRLLAWIEQRIGSETILPPHAAEITLPRQLLIASGGSGWCVPRGAISQVMMRSLGSNAELTCASLRALRRLILWERTLPPSMTHVILYPSRTGVGHRPIVSLAVRRATVNHERSHARTMPRSNRWHAWVDRCMWSWFPQEWDACLVALVDRPGVYADMLNEMGDDPGLVAWQASEELLARLCTMMHAPRDKRIRRTLAGRELQADPGALLALTGRVESHWDTPEGLVAWLDAQFTMDDE